MTSRLIGLAGAVLAVTWLAVNSAALAETIRVRAGEHEGYSRLVLDIAGRAGWKLGRIDGGYLLRVDGPAATFDLSGIFARIPRDRVQDVTSGEEPGSLRLAVSCICHATAADVGNGRIAIDIADGAPPANSAFEEPMTPRPPATAPLASADAVLQPPGPRQDPGGLAATLRYRAQHSDAASLSIYWRQAATDTRPAGSEADDARFAAKVGQDPAGDIGEHDRHTPESAAPEPPRLPDGTASATGSASAATRLPPLPDPAVIAAERQLLEQLGRAAAQGLVVVDESDPHIAGAGDEPAAAPAGTAPQPLQGRPADPAETDEAAFSAETVLDRDARASPLSPHVTGDGASCLADEALQLRDWGDDSPAAAQIGAARSGLTGEFDRPDPASAARLARLYLYLGMGAEARQVLSVFPVAIPDADILRDVARIIDESQIDDGSILHRMRDCDTSVALWAMLAAPDAAAASAVDPAVVVRSFSGLPGALRLHLGQRVADRLVEIGAPEAARSVLAAMKRHAAEGDRTVEMVGAQIDLASGATDAAGKLDDLVNLNDEISVRAIRMAAETRLAQGAAIDGKLTEALAALAFEHRGDPQGAIFAHLEILARAAGGDFGGAVASYERWEREMPDHDRSQTARGLVLRLAENADDRTFLAGIYDHRAIVEEAGTDTDLQLALAKRLGALGFATEVRALLGGEAAASEAGRIALAQAALQLFEAEEALARIDPVTGPEADRLRGDALTRLGRHREAARAYAAAGQEADARRAALRAGDWSGAAGAEAADAALAVLRVVKADELAGAGAAGSLAGSRDLLAQSAGLRANLMTLIGATETAGENRENAGTVTESQ